MFEHIDIILLCYVSHMYFVCYFRLQSQVIHSCNCIVFCVSLLLAYYFHNAMIREKQITKIPQLQLLNNLQEIVYYHYSVLLIRRSKLDNLWILFSIFLKPYIVASHLNHLTDGSNERSQCMFL